MVFATDQTLPLQKLAPEVEARGFESLWVTEKTHVPVSRRTPWPGGELPEWYKRTCDPLVALSAAAAVTQTLRLGTGVLLAGVRDPVITAKAIATLDWLSAGRLELGVGYGWNAEELATHGVDLADAPAVFADRIALLQALWNQDEASYDGPHASVEPSWSWPKPVQQPRPPHPPRWPGERPALHRRCRLRRRLAPHRRLRSGPPPHDAPARRVRSYRP